MVMEQTRKGAVNDVLTRKAARRDAIANLKSFWALGQERFNFDGFIYIYYAAPLCSNVTLTQ